MNNNKLIAEFMEYNYQNDFEHLMMYHTSWDWLMPVIEKCLTTDGKHYKLNDALLTCNIKEVYKTVVEFIKENG